VDQPELPVGSKIIFEQHLDGWTVRLELHSGGLVTQSARTDLAVAMTWAKAAADELV
jgi:hypothetical protein